MTPPGISGQSPARPPELCDNYGKLDNAYTRMPETTGQGASACLELKGSIQKASLDASIGTESPLNPKP